MLLNKHEQDLRQDLQDIESDLRWSAVDLRQIAERLSKAGNEPEAQILLRICQALQTGEERLATYANEVKARIIRRAKDQ